MFKDQIVWITGASAGIGREMAIQFAQAGAQVAVSARRKERLDEVVHKIKKAGSQGLAIACDVTDDQQLAAAVTAIEKEFGRLDIVVANAGFGVGGKIEKLSPADWSRQMNVNLFGVTSTIYYTLPLLKKTKGRLVLMSSVASMIPTPKTGPYSASKAAVRSIGQTLSMELHKTGVSCTTLCPGFVDSEIGQVDNKGQYREEYKDYRPKQLMWPTDKAVKVMLKAIKKRKRSVVITGHGKVLAFMGRHFPGIVHWATVKGLVVF